VFAENSAEATHGYAASDPARRVARVVLHSVWREKFSQPATARGERVVLCRQLFRECHGIQRRLRKTAADPRIVGDVSIGDVPIGDNQLRSQAGWHAPRRDYRDRANGRELSSRYYRIGRRDFSLIPDIAVEQSGWDCSFLQGDVGGYGYRHLQRAAVDDSEQPTVARRVSRHGSASAGSHLQRRWEDSVRGQ